MELASLCWKLSKPTPGPTPGSTGARSSRQNEFFNNSVQNLVEKGLLARGKRLKPNGFHLFALIYSCDAQKPRQDHAATFSSRYS